MLHTHRETLKGEFRFSTMLFRARAHSRKRSGAVLSNDIKVGYIQLPRGARECSKWMDDRNGRRRLRISEGYGAHAKDISHYISSEIAFVRVTPSERERERCRETCSGFIYASAHILSTLSMHRSLCMHAILLLYFLCCVPHRRCNWLAHRMEAPSE